MARVACDLFHPAILSQSETEKVLKMLLNVGCGLHAPEQWTNIDRSPSLVLAEYPRLKRALRHVGILGDAHMAEWPSGILRHDIRKRLPFASGSADAVYSSHTLEHLYFAEAQAVVREFRRVLKGHGILRLALPDAREWARDLLAGEAAASPDAGLLFNRRLAMAPLAQPHLPDRIRDLFASPPHRWQPTPSLVAQMLEEAGFSAIEEREYLDGSLPDLASVEHRSDGTFFIEAIVG